jgi:hypothetical protein
MSYNLRLPHLFSSAAICLVCGFTNLALANDEGAADNTSIDSREQELRRKEEELLRSMNLDSSDVPMAPAASTEQEASTVIVNPSEGGSSAGSITVLEIKAPESAPVTEEQASASIETVSTTEVTKPKALQELQKHPALEPPKKIQAPPLATSNRVRTKAYYDSPDGTTAKRLGSFYRLNPSGASSRPTFDAARSRTVPIQDLTPAVTARPALLTSDELATIRNASTYLKTGPTRLDSTLLKIPQHTEVLIDYRSGAWYRVRTNNGVRGWVPGSALLFDAGTSPRSTVKIGGIQRLPR